MNDWFILILKGRRMFPGSMHVIQIPSTMKGNNLTKRRVRRISDQGQIFGLWDEQLRCSYSACFYLLRSTRAFLFIPLASLLGP